MLDALNVRPVNSSVKRRAGSRRVNARLSWHSQPPLALVISALVNDSSQVLENAGRMTRLEGRAESSSEIRRRLTLQSTRPLGSISLMIDYVGGG